MGALYSPSRYILRKAMQLGQKMAMKDRRLRPDMMGAHQYPSFSLFRTVHRHHIESLDTFAPWDAKLQALIEREANGAKVDAASQRQWELFYRDVAMPIHCAFWYGCEQVWQLESKYTEVMDRHEAALARRPVLHVYHPEVQEHDAREAAKAHESEAQDRWDRVAGKLFDEMHADGDDAFWQMPEASAPFAHV